MGHQPQPRTTTARLQLEGASLGEGCQPAIQEHSLLLTFKDRATEEKPGTGNSYNSRQQKHAAALAYLVPFGGATPLARWAISQLKNERTLR